MGHGGNKFKRNYIGGAVVLVVLVWSSGWGHTWIWANTRQTRP